RPQQAFDPTAFIAVQLTGFFVQLPSQAASYLAGGRQQSFDFSLQCCSRIQQSWSRWMELAFQRVTFARLLFSRINLRAHCQQETFAGSFRPLFAQAAVPSF